MGAQMEHIDKVVGYKITGTEKYVQQISVQLNEKIEVQNSLEKVRGNRNLRILWKRKIMRQRKFKRN